MGMGKFFGLFSAFSDGEKSQKNDAEHCLRDFSLGVAFSIYDAKCNSASSGLFTKHGMMLIGPS